MPLSQSFRLDLRNCEFFIQDGFEGTAAIDDASIVDADTVLNIDTLANMKDGVTVVPIGARFTIAGVIPAGETYPVEYLVTDQNSNKVFGVVVDATSGNFTLTFNGQTTANIAYNANAAAVQAALVALSNIAPGDVSVTSSMASNWLIEFTGVYEGLASPALSGTDVDLMGGADTITVTTEQPGAVTWQLTFTPALDSDVHLPSDDDAITFLPEQIELSDLIGSFEYTVSREIIRDRSRRLLSGHRLGDEQPLQVSANFHYGVLRTGTGETITVYDALLREGGASDWFNASEESCNSHTTRLVVIHTPPNCNVAERERYVFPEFSLLSINPNMGDANVAFSGECNAERPDIFREAAE